MSSMAMMLGNPMEIGIILLVVVVLFGGSKIASLGKGAGEGIREFKKAMRSDDETTETTTSPPAVQPVVSTTPSAVNLQEKPREEKPVETVIR